MQFVFCSCFLVTFIHFIYVRGSFHLSRLWNKVGDKSLKLLKRILLRKLRHVSHYIIWVSSYLPHLHSHFALYLKLTKSKRAHILSKISYIQLVEQVFTLEIQFVEKGKKITGTGIHLRYVLRNRCLILSLSTSKKLLQLR